ncbi:hypothetical protein BpHYR1_036659 [Brachionus plicatilis]|uniref:Uncharacterized protein n=1 Tax=Brachionus plicatilis TaxID=10195 RepID=A0A3M7SNM2_BRAPC|nr:hypothetical protein BpHYR1_036659 [Brachionus plicatilis]
MIPLILDNIFNKKNKLQFHIRSEAGRQGRSEEPTIETEIVRRCELFKQYFCIINFVKLARTDTSFEASIDIILFIMELLIN